MQTLKLSLSLPDDTHPDMELRLSADDVACDVVIALPLQSHRVAQITPVPNDAQAPDPDDDYVLGGYAGI